MAFATLDQVRQEGFLSDEEEVPSDRLTLCLEQAHQAILEQTWLTDETAVPDHVVHAEAVLAIANLFRAMAIQAAVSAEYWKTPSVLVDGHGRVRNLLLVAEQLRREAWGALSAFSRASAMPCLQMTRGDES
ncbi:MAG: hypothetical protein RBU29_03145 [bacterium]|jgi:hypothetical protein|nr:hypothetical protein [bacterium]